MYHYCGRQEAPAIVIFRLLLRVRRMYVARGQFNKTSTSEIYKCRHCSETLEQWLHL